MMEGMQNDLWRELNSAMDKLEEDLIRIQLLREQISGKPATIFFRRQGFLRQWRPGDEAKVGSFRDLPWIKIEIR